MSLYTKTKPRKWTDKDIQGLLDMHSIGFNNARIAEILNRTPVAVGIKLKRLGKNNESYNENHRNEKYSCNESFFQAIQPKTILDLYCGTSSFWKSIGGCEITVTTNDKNNNIEADYHEPAERLIHKLYYDGKRYDVIDLDPYGSAYECFDLAIKMARKGVVITFGELGHRRWKRLDFVRRYYGIESLDKFTIDKLISHVQLIAERNKKRLIPVIVKTWDRIGRAWFRIEPIKITEQWEKP